MQWHPEDMASNALFQALVNAATQVRHARANRAEFFATV